MTLFLKTFALVVAFLLLIQVVPYGRNHKNPPVTMEAPWGSTETKALAARACYDCHSNATTWPWYSTVAPVSWLVQWDVDKGRAKVNFSEWDRPQEETEELGETVREGEMPPLYYGLMHGDAVLNSSEKQTLESALASLTSTMPGSGEGRGGSEREDRGR